MQFMSTDPMIVEEETSLTAAKQHILEKPQPVETSEEAETEWVQQVNAIAAQTLYTSGCNSWYLGANIPGKPRIFMPHIGFPTYVEKCNEVAAQDYRGFKFS